MKTALIAFAATTLAGAVQAQPLDLRLPESAGHSVRLIALAGAPAKAIPDLANPLDPIARPVLQPGVLDSAVFAKTAIDHKFDHDDRLSGSIGFLCGRQAGHDTGAGAAYGVDPHGRFLGAKFSIAFK